MSNERLRKEVERQINENTPNDTICKWIMVSYPINNVNDLIKLSSKHGFILAENHYR